MSMLLMSLVSLVCVGIALGERVLMRFRREIRQQQRFLAHLVRALEQRLVTRQDKETR